MRKLIGKVKVNREVQKFEFEVPDDATEDEIEEELYDASRNWVNMWWEESEDEK